MVRYEFHEYANLFPLLEGDEFEALKKDIRDNGLQLPIILYDNKILDGRNRYRACQDLGITPPYEPYNGSNPLEHVISLNLKRRHLNASQRALIATEYLPLLQKQAKQRMSLGGGDKKSGKALKPNPIKDAGQARDKAAALFNVSPRYVEDAKKLKQIAPQSIQDISSGKKTITEITKEIKKKAFHENIAQQKKILREHAPPQPPDTYGIIVIDPPWNYGTQEHYDPAHYRGSNPYPEMTQQELETLALPSDDDCILWLWTTNKFMRQAYHLLDAWGFEEKTILTWDKEKIGLGLWLRGQTEHCILATKGKPKVNLKGHSTLLRAKAGRHSEKPQAFYDLVEDLCLPAQKLDYFGRKKREGWYVYGLLDKEEKTNV